MNNWEVLEHPVDGIKYCFYTVVDTKGKSAQTDNGLEFQGFFDDYLTKQNIPHLFTYPHGLPITERSNV